MSKPSNRRTVQAARRIHKERAMRWSSRLSVAKHFIAQSERLMAAIEDNSFVETFA